MKKVFHHLLFLTFIITVLVPITGIQIHKLASTLFLILSFVHVIYYSKKMTVNKVLLLVLIIISLVTGIFGMIMDDIPVVLNSHKVLSISLVFFLSIHIFVYHKKIRT